MRRLPKEQKQKQQKFSRLVDRLLGSDAGQCPEAARQFFDLGPSAAPLLGEYLRQREQVNRRTPLYLVGYAGFCRCFDSCQRAEESI